MRARCSALALCAALLAGAAAAVAQDAGPEGTEPAAPEASGEALPEDVGPIEWQPSHGSDCHRHGKTRVCEGPRRVPVVSAEAQARITELGLDRPRARYLALDGPDETWVEAALAHTGPITDELTWPVPSGRFWRGFGTKRRLAKGRGGKLRHLRERHLHAGVDIGADRGAPIVAAQGGLVAYADNGMGGYGNALVIVHADGSSALYGHCSALYVTAGTLVSRGQTVAAVGDTGLAHGTHLHFEWHVGGRAVDPLPHFVERPEGSHGASEGAEDE